MKIPEGIKTRHKIRDAKMVRMYAEGRTFEEIGQRFKMSKQGVQQIVYKNRHILEIDRVYHKQKRLNKLERILDDIPLTLSDNKDVLNVIAEHRKEVDGDGQISVENKVSNVVININHKTREEIKSRSENRIEHEQNSNA